MSLKGCLLLRFSQTLTKLSKLVPTEAHSVLMGLQQKMEAANFG